LCRSECDRIGQARTKRVADDGVSQGPVSFAKRARGPEKPLRPIKVGAGCKDRPSFVQAT
jgi:hypothetical protein